MTFSYSKENLSAKDAKWQRWLEILPGACSWALLVVLTILSIFFPFSAAILIVAFYLYWFLRILYSTIFLVFSYFLLNIERPTRWMGRIHRLANAQAYVDKHAHRAFGRHWRRWFSHRIHIKQVEDLLASGCLPPSYKDIYHLVLFPIIKENKDIVEPAIEAIRRQHFPLKQMVIIFALEERAQPQVHQSVRELEGHYKDVFLECLTVMHPSGVVGEARVKGANVTHAAKHAAKLFQDKGIAFERIIVSCFDADTVVSPDYFACLTYHFMACPQRQRASFQPIPVYHNNIWNVPGFARVIETGSSFFQLIEATDPTRLVTFSSHSMSFKALVEVGYWPIDMISDDSAIFWKAYIHYDGDYRVIPMYVTVSMDVAAADTWWQTVQSVYKQKRRWAWGVENLPIVMRAFLQSKSIPWQEKIRHGYKLFEGHLSWATWGFILSVVGWLPVFFARKEFASSVAYYNIPDIAGTVFHLGSISLLITIVLSVSLLPKTQKRHSWLLKIGHALEWLLVPVIVLFLSALPALDAQTRLMFGRYLEFWVTDKKRTPLKSSGAA